MLDNCCYNQVKLLHKLSCLLWFIEKHGKPDAKSMGDTECLRICEELSQDLAKYIDRYKRCVGDCLKK